MAYQSDTKLRVPYELIPTRLPGVFISPSPPDGFDPQTASPASLIRHGLLWRRPEHGADPALRAAWERVFSRSWRAEDRIIPEFEPQIGKTHNLRGAERHADGNFTGAVWAGCVISGTWTGAIGFWTIPTVSPSSEPQGTEGGWNSSSWVGIDGTFGSNDVLQAGVQQVVDSNGNASYVAWYEWFAPAQSNSPSYINQVNIPNFAVSPGETVYCSVQYISPERMQPGATVTALWRSNETHLDLFATGTDGAVWSTWWEAGPGWQPWFLIHPEIKMQPGATVTALWRSNETHLDLFATGTDGAVWSTWWEGGPGWQPWFLIHPEIKMQPGATVTALWRSNETHLDLFATGTDGAVWSTWWEAGPSWQPWFFISGAAGQVYFANETTGQYFSITLAPPPGATFSGNCAEWIMEAPDGGEPISSLPRFTPVNFTSAICCGPNNTIGNPTNGSIFTIVGFGTTLTSAVLSNYGVTINYVGR
jgi:hypothetical protein